MGWPEFQKCCGCLSLTTGTIVIGCWTLMFSLISLLIYSILLAIGIRHNQSDPEYTVPLLAYILVVIAMFIDLLQGVLGIMLIASRKNAKCLSRLVFYMVGLCLINLLVVLISVSTEDHFQHYVSAIMILIDGYFILIVRSNQLQLEGRLTNPIDVGRRQRERGRAVFQNRAFPPPPPYEEAIRYGTIHRPDYATTSIPVREVSNEDGRTITIGQTPTAVQIQPSTPIHTQPLATSSDKKECPKEPECVIYDEEQFSAICNTQVVERSPASNSTSSTAVVEFYPVAVTRKPSIQDLRIEP